jgi:hypothetical protein
MVTDLFLKKIALTSSLGYDLELKAKLKTNQINSFLGTFTKIENFLKKTNITDVYTYKELLTNKKQYKNKINKIIKNKYMYDYKTHETIKNLNKNTKVSYLFFNKIYKNNINFENSKNNNVTINKKNQKINNNFNFSFSVDEKKHKYNFFENKNEFKYKRELSKNIIPYFENDKYKNQNEFSRTK